MARHKEKNIVERLAEAGEDAIHRINGVDKVLAAFGALPKRVDELQRSVRGLEKLEKRLGAIEKRLDKLEGKGSPSSRKTSSAKRSTAPRKSSSSSSSSS
jgi:TolA-binding protein